MSEGTRSEDYSSTYYNDAHLGGYDNYTWDNEEWRTFFLSLADRVVGIANPRTVLDVGCARGLLVQALAAKGVDATGIDISEYAIDSAHDDVRHRLRVTSAKDPVGERYDLVSCIEVLEHMGPVDAQQAMPAAATRPNWSPAAAEIANARQITTETSRISSPAPTRPSSSPATVKMKSVCCSGTKPERVCEPSKRPWPKRPPLPTAIRACSVL